MAFAKPLTIGNSVSGYLFNRNARTEDIKIGGNGLHDGDAYYWTRECVIGRIFVNNSVDITTSGLFSLKLSSIVDNTTWGSFTGTAVAL